VGSHSAIAGTAWKGVDAVLFNILEEECIEVHTIDKKCVKLTLPGVFAALGKNSIEAFSNLRPHQRHPWHAFLCQLGAIALTDGGKEIPPADKNTPFSELPGVSTEGEWKELLFALAPDNDAWSLVVDDTNKPAFLQPPVPDGIGALTTTIRTPDELDVIVTSKNTDEKTRRITSFKTDHWLFALVSLQGQAGYSKAGSKGNYYNSVRQYGAYATRPGVGIITSSFWGDQWGRDCRLLIELMDGEREIGWNFENGKRLLWLFPWDGTTSLPLEELHPYFIETCRRLRLRVADEESIHACVGSSTKARVSGGDYKGVVDDPWIPVNKKTGSAFNSSPTWENMAKIILDQKAFYRAPAQIPRAFDGAHVSVRFCILVRGQGSTEEYHEIVVPVPPEKRNFLSSHDDTGGQVLNTMIDLADSAKSKVLYPAVTRLFQESFEQGKKSGRKKALPLASVACQLMDHVISDHFFSFLWNALPNKGEGENSARQYNSWIEFLRSTTENIFQDILNRRLNSSEAEFLSTADAELFFFNARNKHLPLIEISSGGEQP
jgi:CRISPR system Cascade subunit CasA